MGKQRAKAKAYPGRESFISLLFVIKKPDSTARRVTSDRGSDMLLVGVKL